MTQTTTKNVRCGICLVKKPQDEMQVLQCKHEFCGQCLSLYMGTWCPAERCEGGRSTDIVVDEMADHETAQRISLGTHTLSWLNLEEKLKCDGRKHGNLLCENVARMTLDNCRHNFCYDCMIKGLHIAKQYHSAPICPRALCCNKILKAEVRQLSICYPVSSLLCHQIYDLVTETENSPPPAIDKKNEMVVDCSIYGQETTVKRIVIPRASLISDMLSAILQLQKLAKDRTTSSLGIYIRHDGKRYEQLRPKLLGKKPVREMNWPDSMAIVIDVDGCLSKKRA